jgi:hypothetical protein
VHAPGVAVLALIGILLPSSYGLMAGYQLSDLKQENRRLASEKTQLELHEARLVNSDRLEELARTQEFDDPASGKTFYLDSKSQKALALNRR